MNRLGLAAGLALALVALAHPGVADRATIAVGASLIIVATAVRVAVRQGAASGLPGSARWLALLWLLAMLGSAAVNDAWHVRALLPPIVALALLWLGARLGRVGGAMPVVVSIVGVAVLIALHAALQHTGLDPLPRLDEFPGRVVGPFDNPNHLGGFAALALPLALAGYLALCNRSTRFPLVVGLGVGVVAIYSCMLLAGSRGAIWAALAGSLVVVAGWARASHLQSRRPAWLPLLLLSVSLIVVTRLLQEQPVMQGDAGQVSVGQRLQALSNMTGDAAETDLTVLHRRVLWRAAWDIFAHNPVLGVGPGRYQQACVQALENMAADRRVVLLSRLQRLDVTRFAHNEWLHSFAEVGLAGTIPWTLLIILWAATSSREVWKGREGIYLGALGACGAVLVHGLVSYPFYVPTIAGSFWILLGISYYYIEEHL
ncbi:MAG: O-antigen ligase family protein [Candidatus Latescibacterota bacterium]